MHVRQFGLPVRPVVGPQAQTSVNGVSQPSVAKADTADKSVAAGVALEGGALVFPRGAQELAEKQKTERARVLLETLRGGGGEAFGGKVKGGVDVASGRSVLKDPRCPRRHPAAARLRS